MVNQAGIKIVFTLVLMHVLCQTGQWCEASLFRNNKRPAPREDDKLAKDDLASGLDKVLEQEIVPDIIDVCPGKVLRVDYFTTGTSAKFGNVIKPNQAREEPTFSYEAEPDKMYTIIMVDPDAPTRGLHTLRNVVHYIKNNIPGNKTSEGELAVEYVPPSPLISTGFHRIVFVLYKQNDRVKFEKLVTKTQLKGRGPLDLRSYAKENNLDQPVAINFYLSDFDIWVRGILAQFG